MPTFHDPVADAEEAYQAIRSLAHQTATIDDPRRIYAMLGNLSAATAALGQTLHQIARFHDTNKPDFPRRAAQATARHEASWELHRAGEILSHVAGCIDRAHVAEGQIEYRPPTTPGAVLPSSQNAARGLGL